MGKVKFWDMSWLRITFKRKESLRKERGTSPGGPGVKNLLSSSGGLNPWSGNKALERQNMKPLHHNRKSCAAAKTQCNQIYNKQKFKNREREKKQLGVIGSVQEAGGCS